MNQSKQDNLPEKTEKYKGFTSLAQMVSQYSIEEKPGYISQEFQDFGYRMAVELDDLPHKSLYIKLAKRKPRGLLESALSFVSDASGVKSRAKLFMWKLKQLEAEAKEKKALIDPEVEEPNLGPTNLAREAELATAQTNEPRLEPDNRPPEALKSKKSKRTKKVVVAKQESLFSRGSL